MDSDEQAIVDWVNFPEGISLFSLWDTLHDGDLLAIESDLLVRTLRLRFDVDYVRDFHHLPEGTQFVIVVEDVRSVRSVRSVPWPGGCSIPPSTPREQESALIADYHRKWRQESLSWSDFEKLTGEPLGLEVSNADLGRGTDAVALRLGLLAARDSYVEAYVRGERIAFYVGDRQVTPEEFVAFGEAYWNAFANKAKAD
ncbi:MAG: hypothetical protein WAN03_05335 [Candidatus Sulfotelmatobacter sp.]